MSHPLPDDPVFLEKGASVAHNLGTYGRYGSRARALEAFARRAPGFTAADYEAGLDFFLELFAIAKEAVQRHHHPDGKGPFAKFEDVDFDAVMGELDAVRPGFALPFKDGIGRWSVLYWILK